MTYFNSITVTFNQKRYTVLTFESSIPEMIDEKMLKSFKNTSIAYIDQHGMFNFDHTFLQNMNMLIGGNCMDVNYNTYRFHNMKIDVLKGVNGVDIVVNDIVFQSKSDIDTTT